MCKLTHLDICSHIHTHTHVCVHVRPSSAPLFPFRINGAYIQGCQGYIWSFFHTFHSVSPPLMHTCCLLFFNSSFIWPLIAIFFLRHTLTCMSSHACVLTHAYSQPCYINANMHTAPHTSPYRSLSLRVLNY